MRYSEVVNEAKKQIKGRLKNGTYKNNSITYGECPVWEEGEHINLWTYWQGYQIQDIDSGVDIMLVGQDWGNPRSEEVLNKIRGIQAGGENIIENETNPTNKALIEVFKLFDCDITKPVYNKRLFFTNYSLGYRTGDQSEQGGMTKGLMKQDAQLFRDLVGAIKPKVIICLGQLVYECVTEKTAQGWVNQLKTGKPFVENYPHDQNIRVYGVAHCGSRGMNNIGGKENNMKAWEQIAKDYKQLYG